MMQKRSSVDAIEIFRSMNPREMRHLRLDTIESWLSDGLMVSWRDVPATLRQAGLVSSNYGMRCLLLDIWFLKRKYCSPNFKSSDDVIIDHAKISFQIVLRGLMDLQSGRPCDLKAWKKDMPSDLQYCTEDSHLCYEDAERYLATIDRETEENCGIPAGKIRDLVKRIKQDPIFQIGSVLNSEVPTSFVALKLSDPRS